LTDKQLTKEKRNEHINSRTNPDRNCLCDSYFDGGDHMVEPIEKDDNIVYSCPKHGKETYFQIKRLEQMRKMRDYVYVWFKHRNRSEKMWVRITSGSRLKGQGTLDNQPQVLTHLKLRDIVKFKTDVEGITWGR